jgi:hypothetical protein
MVTSESLHPSPPPCPIHENVGISGGIEISTQIGAKQVRYPSRMLEEKQKKFPCPDPTGQTTVNNHMATAQ